MSRTAPQDRPADSRSVSRLSTHLLATSAALFVGMFANRRARAAARPADPRTADEILADLTAAIDRLPPELPSLVGALAMRSAICSAHSAEVAA